MQPIYKKNITKKNEIYKNQLYPRVLRKFNFENNHLPNLIYNLKKIDYEFIWVGNNIGCKVYNPEICIDYGLSPNDIKNIWINKYILESFLKNTPIIQIKNILMRNLFPDEIGDNYYKNDFTNEFISNYKFSRGKKHKNYFYFVHNLFPKGPYVFKKNCDLKKDISKSEVFTLYGYVQNYKCALKKIDELIFFLKKEDPNAVVVFQSDHGIVYDKNNQKDLSLDVDRYKIFNMLKLPRECKNMIKDNMDNINSVRLALSCATNTNIKLLETQNRTGL